MESPRNENVRSIHCNEMQLILSRWLTSFLDPGNTSPRRGISTVITFPTEFHRKHAKNYEIDIMGAPQCPPGARAQSVEPEAQRLLCRGWSSSPWGCPRPTTGWAFSCDITGGLAGPLCLNLRKYKFTPHLKSGKHWCAVPSRSPGTTPAMLTCTYMTNCQVFF